MKKFKLAILLLGLFVFLWSCGYNESKNSNTGDNNTGIAKVKAVTRKPFIVELTVDSTQRYNLQSLKGSAFLEVPVPKDIYPFLQGTFRSYQDLSIEIQNRSYSLPEVSKTTGSSSDSPYQLYQKDSLWNTISLKHQMPLIDFDELTLISFPSSEIFGCLIRLEYGITQAFDRGELIILQTGFTKKGCIEDPGAIRTKLKWFLVSKIPPGVEVKFDYKAEKE